MTRQAIIDRTINVINLLPAEKAKAISDFADYIIKQYEEQQLKGGIQQFVTNSKAFEFLNNEEDIYSLSDLKQVYNG